MHKRFVTLVALAATAGHAGAAPDHFDIVGLRLGMTESQAREALKKHDPALRLQDKTLHYTYHDGVSQHRTPDFLSQIVAVNIHGGTQTETITLQFSTPPKPQRLVGVDRIATLPNPPTHAQLLDTVTAKYGAPTETRSTGGTRSPQTTARWAESGHPQCWRTNAKQVTAFAPASPVLDVLKQLSQRQAQGLAPTDLSQCGATLQYRASGDPVRQFVMSMNDMGYWLETLQATGQWVSGLDAEAKKARVGKGQATKL